MDHDEDKIVLIALRIDQATKEKFFETCAQQELSASKVLRSFIREYIGQNYTPNLFDAETVQRVTEASQQAASSPARPRAPKGRAGGRAGEDVQ